MIKLQYWIIDHDLKQLFPSGFDTKEAAEQYLDSRFPKWRNHTNFDITPQRFKNWLSAMERANKELFWGHTQLYMLKIYHHIIGGT